MRPWTFWLAIAGGFIAVGALAITPLSPLARLTLFAAGLTMLILAMAYPEADK